MPYSPRSTTIGTMVVREDKSIQTPRLLEEDTCLSAEARDNKMNNLIYEKKNLNHKLDKMEYVNGAELKLPSFWLNSFTESGHLATELYQPEFHVGFHNFEAIYGSEIRTKQRILLYESTPEKDSQFSVGLRSTVSVSTSASAPIYTNISNRYCSPISESGTRQLCDFMGIVYQNVINDGASILSILGKVVSILELEKDEHVNNVCELRSYLASRCNVVIKEEVRECQESFVECIRELGELFRSKVPIRMLLPTKPRSARHDSTEESDSDCTILIVNSIIKEESIPSQLSRWRKEVFLPVLSSETMAEDINAIFLLECFCGAYIDSKVDCSITYDNFFQLGNNSGNRVISNSVVDMCKSVLVENEFMRVVRQGRAVSVSDIIGKLIAMTCRDNCSGFESYYTTNSHNISKGWPFLDTVLTITRAGMSVKGGILACYALLLNLSRLVEVANKGRSHSNLVSVPDFHNARWWKFFIVDVAKSVSTAVMKRVKEEWIAYHGKEGVKVARCPFQTPFAFALNAYMQKSIVECIIEFGLDPKIKSAEPTNGFVRYLRDDAVDCIGVTGLRSKSDRRNKISTELILLSYKQYVSDLIEEKRNMEQSTKPWLFTESWLNCLMHKDRKDNRHGSVVGFKSKPGGIAINASDLYPSSKMLTPSQYFLEAINGQRDAKLEDISSVRGRNECSNGQLCSTKAISVGRALRKRMMPLPITLQPSKLSPSRPPAPESPVRPSRIDMGLVVNAMNGMNELDSQVLVRSAKVVFDKGTEDNITPFMDFICYQIMHFSQHFDNEEKVIGGNIRELMRQITDLADYWSPDKEMTGIFCSSINCAVSKASIVINEVDVSQVYIKSEIGWFRYYQLEDYSRAKATAVALSRWKELDLEIIERKHETEIKQVQQTRVEKLAQFRTDTLSKDPTRLFQEFGYWLPFDQLWMYSLGSLSCILNNELFMSLYNKSHCIASRIEIGLALYEMTAEPLAKAGTKRKRNVYNDNGEKTIKCEGASVSELCKIGFEDVCRAKWMVERLSDDMSKKAMDVARAEYAITSYPDFSSLAAEERIFFENISKEVLSKLDELKKKAEASRDRVCRGIEGMNPVRHQAAMIAKEIGYIHSVSDVERWLEGDNDSVVDDELSAITLYQGTTIYGYYKWHLHLCHGLEALKK